MKKEHVLIFADKKVTFVFYHFLFNTYFYNYSFIFIHGKNDFTEISKILVKYRSEINFVRTLKLVARILKFFCSIVMNESVLHNYFDSIKLFSDIFN